MRKRGQSGEVIKYFIIAMMIVAITFFGYSAVTKVRDNACKVELAKFEIDIGKLDKSVKFGSIKEFTKVIPCDVDEIYFFDLEDDINLDLIEHLPLLKDSIRDKVEKNVFLVRDNKILATFYAGNLDIGYPNYICFVPKFGKMNFFVEGKGEKVSVFSGCLQPECTLIPLDTSIEDAAGIIREAENFGNVEFCKNCPKGVPGEFAKFIQTRENAEIFRKYEVCKEDGKTIVEIIIRPKGNAVLKNFKFYESIPKNCISDLETYLSSVEGDVSIKNDPLIIWSLDDIKTEERISYVLDSILDADCREAIEGLGVAQLVEDGSIVVVPPLPGEEIPESEPVNTRPSISLSNSIIEPGERQLVVSNLWLAGSDLETLSSDLSYSITSQTNQAAINCEVIANKELWCDALSGSVESSIITMQVFDGELTGSDTFVITIDISSVNNAPEFTSPLLDVSFDFKSGEQVAENNMWIYLYDEETKAQDLIYSIVSQSNLDLVECHLENLNQIKCQTLKNEDGQSEITVDVSDGENSVQDSFTVSVSSVSLSTCSSCGIVLGSFCDKSDCESISEGCFYEDRFLFKSCESCGAINSCEDYPNDEGTCESDACSVGKCDWDDGECEDGEICGDGDCDGDESSANCPLDCGAVTVSGFKKLKCAEGIDPQFCTDGVQCPSGTELIGDVTSCGNFINRKDQYTCADISFTACEINPTCAVGVSIEETSCAAPKASLSASFSNLKKNSGSPPSGFGGGNWWYYDISLKETSGNAGITVNSRQKCFSASDGNNWCNSEKTDIIPNFGTNYISANGIINERPNWVWFTAGFTYTITETYRGIDDNGNNVQSSYSFTVS